jgi:hypothetical protein
MDMVEFAQTPRSLYRRIFRPCGHKRMLGYFLGYGTYWNFFNSRAYKGVQNGAYYFLSSDLNSPIILYTFPKTASKQGVLVL